jgi:cytochrome c oxidase accessory protein FixG
MELNTAAEAESLYRKEPKVYPRQIKGRFTRLRNIAVVVLLGLFYLVPWFNLAGRQAVLFDLPARKFYILGLTFWPQDFIYLALLLILAGLSLFFFTALAGRLWCGFACPQTVWTEVFLLIEKWTEGDRARRMKLDKRPWDADKLRRKVTKQVLWIVLSVWTGFTFVGFFTPVRELGAAVLEFSLSPWATFWMVFYSFATYGNAGIMREQVCKYMCPYARFQSAMFDKDTLIISYDEARGEPRGGRGKKADLQKLNLGSCIDCTLCVQVCPTGIDIRNGLQYECIACAACIDICDQVMDKMGYQRGLVKYTTEHSLSGSKTRFLRPRILVYATLLDGQIENAYTLKLINMDERDHIYTVSVKGNDAVSVEASRSLQLAAEDVGVFSLRLKAPRSAGTGSLPLEIVFEAEDDSAIKKTAKRVHRTLVPASLAMDSDRNPVSDRGRQCLHLLPGSQQSGLPGG